MFFVLTAVFSCLFLPTTLRADASQAQADFQAGRRYRAARQWGQAVRAYLAALRDDPGMDRAYKDLGAVYYLVGDNKGALYYYDRYLALVPDDGAARAFDGRLRASLGLPPASAAPAPVPHDGLFRPGFGLRLPLTGVFAGAGAVDKFYTVADSGGGFTETNKSPGSTLGYAVGVGADYGMSNGFVAGLDLLYGPVCDYSVSNQGAFDGQSIGVENDTYGVTQMSVFLTPGWRFKVGADMIVEPRLGLGFMDTSVALSNAVDYNAYGQSLGGTNTTDTAASSGTAFAVWPEVRGEYLFGRIGVGASLGYLYGTAAAQKYTSASANTGFTKGSPVQYQSSPGVLSNWSAQTGGLSFGLFATYHFQPVFW